jgi:hypothetical protein
MEYLTVNLSRKQGTTASQSSTFGGVFLASLAIDGHRGQTDYTKCSHTDTGQTKAWFQVDLGREHSLKYVKIFYRNKGKIMTR